MHHTVWIFYSPSQVFELRFVSTHKNNIHTHLCQFFDIISSDSLGTSSNNGPFPIFLDKIWWWKKFREQETIYYVERFYHQTNDNYNNMDNTKYGKNTFQNLSKASTFWNIPTDVTKKQQINNSINKYITNPFNACCIV